MTNYMTFSQRTFSCSTIRTILIVVTLCLFFTVSAVSAGDSPNIVGQQEYTVVTAKLDSEFYFIGDEIGLSGTSTSGNELNFTMIGTNFNQNIDTIISEKTFGKEWSVKIPTKDIRVNDYPMSSGGYTINILDDESVVAEVTIFLISEDASFISITSSPTTVKPGDTAQIIGTTTPGSSITESLQYYIFGPEYFDNGTTLISRKDIQSPDNYFEIPVDIPKTASTGEYYIVIQHPMNNGAFEFYPKGNQIWLRAEQDSIIFDVFELYNAQSPKDAANRLLDGFDSQLNSDDKGVVVSFTVSEKSDVIPETPSENSAYTDIIITPRGTLEPGQTVTGTFTINIPASSVTNEDKFTFSSPLEYAKWHFSVYDSADHLLMEEDVWHEGSPHQMTGFITDYRDRDVKLKVSFKGNVHKSSMGSAINVISVDCTSSQIGSYISPSQKVTSAYHDYSDIIITPRDTLEAGQKVTGIFTINIPAGSVTNEDKFTFNSPLEYVKWHFSVYDSADHLLMEQGVWHEGSPHQMTGFITDYRDRDVKLKVYFEGKVPDSAKGSYINVLRIDCTSPQIGSYLSPGQGVLPLSAPDQKQSALFYGTVETADGALIPAKTEIVAVVDGVNFPFTIMEDGKLGGSNSADKNLIISGVKEGSLVQFKIGDTFAEQTSSFVSGGKTEVALTFELDIMKPEIDGDKGRVPTATILAPSSVLIPDNIQVTVQESSDADKTTQPTVKPDKTKEFKIYEISIPEELNGLVTVSIDIFISTNELNEFFGGDSSLIRVYHGKDGEWQIVKIVNISQVSDGILITINANDFSPYMIAAYQESKPASSPTSSTTDTGSGNYQFYPRQMNADGIICFGTSPVVTGMEVPTTSTGTFILNTNPYFEMPENGYYRFEIEAPGYDVKAKINGAISFQIPLTELEVAGWTPEDIVLNHGKVNDDNTITWESLPTTLVKIENGLAYYKATINGCSPFYIGFIKDGSVVNDPIVEPITPPIDEPQDETQEILPQIDNTNKPDTPPTPTPILGVMLGGLGATAVILRRK